MVLPDPLRTHQMEGENKAITKKSVFGRNICDIFIIFSRLEILTFINEKKIDKKKKMREKNPVL